MFPIRDHNPSGRRPYVTLALIAANVAVFCAYWFTLTEWELGWFYAAWGLTPARLMAGEGWETVVTHMFLHGGWMHLAGNMLFLWIYGDNLEEEMGHGRFLLFYLAAGLAAAALQAAVDLRSQIPMVGASGAIAGVMGGYLLLFPRAKVDVLFFFVVFFRIVPIPAWAVLGVWFASQLVFGVATPSDQGGVAYWAHAGGFVGGLLLALPVWRARGAGAWWRRTAGAPPHPEARYALSASRIPRVRR
jgi:membrane associated rhomboid family serine protease